MAGGRDAILPTPPNASMWQFPVMRLQLKPPTMHGRWKACCFLVLTLCTPIKSQFQKEQFREELSIRPLHDGRVLSRFSFTTQLNETEPRDPRSLALEDDDCEQQQLKFNVPSL